MGALVSGRHFFRVYGLLKKWPEMAEEAEWNRERERILCPFIVLCLGILESVRSGGVGVIPCGSLKKKFGFVYLMQGSFLL